MIVNRGILWHVGLCAVVGCGFVVSAPAAMDGDPPGQVPCWDIKCTSCCEAHTLPCSVCDGQWCCPDVTNPGVLCHIIAGSGWTYHVQPDGWDVTTECVYQLMTCVYIWPSGYVCVPTDEWRNPTCSGPMPPRAPSNCPWE
jgi:hypothetical protein